MNENTSEDVSPSFNEESYYHEEHQQGDTGPPAPAGVAHQTYSISYEPHYQQMHPLIYYEEPAHHHYHHHPLEHHPHHAHHLHHQPAMEHIVGPVMPQVLAPNLPMNWDQQLIGCAGQLKQESNDESDSGSEGQEASSESQARPSQSAHEERVVPPGQTGANTITHRGRGRRAHSGSPMPNNRDLHNEIERRRRSRIKTCCDALKLKIPGLKDKTDKATVLENTVQFINHLHKCPNHRCNCENWSLRGQ